MTACVKRWLDSELEILVERVVVYRCGEFTSLELNSQVGPHERTSRLGV